MTRPDKSLVSDLSTRFLRCQENSLFRQRYVSASALMSMKPIYVYFPRIGTKDPYITEILSKNTFIYIFVI